MTIDAEGNLYLTGRGVTVFDKTGKQIDHIDVPEKWSANVCFSGPDRKTLFITASESLYSIRLRVLASVDGCPLKNGVIQGGDPANLANATAAGNRKPAARTDLFPR
jgi:hypothetical protein